MTCSKVHFKNNFYKEVNRKCEIKLFPLQLLSLGIGYAFYARGEQNTRSRFKQFVSLTLELPIVNRKLLLPKSVKMTGL